MRTRDEAMQARRSVLPWYGKPIWDAYKREIGGRYRYDFLTLAREAYDAFIYGCSYASIIVAGEALFRRLLINVTEILATGRSVSLQSGRRSLTVQPGQSADLLDILTLHQTIQILAAELRDPKLTERMDAIRVLRNRAAHGDLPLLIDWDPDGSTSITRRMALSKIYIEERRIAMPEGYKFHKGDTWVKVDLRNQPCGSLKSLPPDERISVVQQLLLLEVLNALSMAHP